MQAVTFLKVFRWTSLLLVSILLTTGIQSIIYASNGQQTIVGPSVRAVSVDNLFHVAFYFVVLASVMCFVLRYLIWSPWAIYRRIWKLGEEGPGRLSPDELVNGLANAKHSDQVWSLGFLAVEFYIAFLIVSSLTNTSLLLVLLLALPIVDFLPFLGIFLFRVLVFFCYDMPRLFLKEALDRDKPEHPWRNKLRNLTGLPAFFLIADLVDFALPAGFLWLSSRYCPASTRSLFGHLLSHIQECEPLPAEMPLKLAFLVLAILLPSLIVFLRYHSSLRRISYVLQHA